MPWLVSTARDGCAAREVLEVLMGFRASQESEIQALHWHVRSAIDLVSCLCDSVTIRILIYSCHCLTGLSPTVVLSWRTDVTQRVALLRDNCILPPSACLRVVRIQIVDQSEHCTLNTLCLSIVTLQDCALLCLKSTLGIAENGEGSDLRVTWQERWP